MEFGIWNRAATIYGVMTLVTFLPPAARLARSGGYSIQLRPSVRTYVRPEPCQRDISRKSGPISILFGMEVPIGNTPTPVDFGDLHIIFKVVTSKTFFSS